MWGESHSRSGSGSDELRGCGHALELPEPQFPHTKEIPPSDKDPAPARAHLEGPAGSAPTLLEHTTVHSLPWSVKWNLEMAFRSWVWITLYGKDEGNLQL